MGALDWFRIIAAFLVAAIHISPLEDFSFWGDLMLTRIVGRVAVPFFFMVTGYFVLAQGRWERVQESLAKNLRWYLAAIVMYLPVNWYAGKLAGLTFGTALRELLIGGTFYHLWYLPGVITGLLISWGLWRWLGSKKALFAAATLYLVGVLGDSYYGLAAQIPALESLYAGLFAIMENTRNGVFLAPLFLLLGAQMGRKRHVAGGGRLKTRERALPEQGMRGRLQEEFLFWGIGLAVSLAGMTAEGLLVHAAGWPHHDSMYLTLPVVMTFLFGLLVRLPAAQKPKLRAVALWVYLLHPLCIVVVRAFAGVTKTEALLVENHLVHYLCVTVASLGAAYILSLFTDTGRRRRRAPSIWVKSEQEHMSWEEEKEDAKQMEEKRQLEKKTAGGRAWVETDLAALSGNVNQFRQVLSPGSRVMAVVKADAYGHGAVPVSLHLQKQGITDFAVATAAEGISLRQAGIRGNILILGYTSPEEWPGVYENDLIQTIVDEEYAVAMNRFGCANGSLRAHLALDTGMHRLGVSAGDIEAVREIFLLPAIRIEGVFSHLCVAGSRSDSDVEYTRQQLKRFEAMRGYIEKLCIQLNRGDGERLCYHIQNSFGLLNYPQLKYDFVRMGIALYGAYETAEDRPQLELGLEPVMAVRARVAMVRTVQPGMELGYGRAWRAPGRRQVATVTIGYADGIPRSYGNGRAQVLIRGRRYPVVGRVCMDQLLVDVTGEESAESRPEGSKLLGTEILNWDEWEEEESGGSDAVRSGDVVTLIGRDGEEEIRAEEAAGWCDTITNELLCRMGGRLKRYMTKDEAVVSEEDRIHERADY
ncbi:MAG: alanine racemase [Lachnospiraceae bacterium]|nr:alanine racemase [Lachnospiraceae bacterium]